MLLTLSFSITFSILVLIFYKNKSISFLFCVFMWLLFGWNYMNGDYESYETLYNNFILEYNNNNYEIGFKFLIFLSKRGGLSFQEFFIVVSAIIMFLFYRFFIKFSEVPGIFLFSYFWFFFPVDYVFLRNTLAFAILLQGFYCFFFDTKYKVIKYLFFVTIALTIHSSSAFYYLFLFAFSKKKLSFPLILSFVLCSLFVVVILSSFVPSLVAYLTGGDRLGLYSSSFGVFVINSFLQVINVGIIYLFVTSRDRDKRDTTDLLIYNMNIILLLLIIPYYSMGIFVRIFRNISVINIAYILGVLYSLWVSNNRKKAVSLFPVFILYLLSYMRFIIPYWDETIYALLKNNLIIH